MIALVLILFTFLNLSQQQTVDQLIEGYTQIVGQHKLECAQESGANPNFIDDEILHGQFNYDKATKCFWKCFYKKLNLISANDEVLEDNIKAYIGLSDKKVAEEVFEKCAHFRGSDACETASSISRCVYSSSKAVLEK